MSTYYVTASATVNAPATEVYKLISDYHTGHPSILPPRYFKSLQVIQGGVGAGTVVDVDMEVYRVKAHYHLTVSEPQPGRVLQEEDAEAGVVTTFTVEPVDQAQAHVTIATTMSTAPGLKGWLEKRMNPPIMRRIYQEELAQLATVANQKRQNV